MKKPRTLTPEEATLWRESNRDTARVEHPKAPAAPLVGAPKTPAATAKRSATRAPEAPPTMAPKRSTRPLPALSRREAAKRFKSHPEIDATLDLHGLTKIEAYTQVQRFIAHQHRVGHRHVVIITGKGRGNAMGVLRSALPDWLNELPLRALISTVTHAAPEKGGDGVTHVLLKRL